MRIVRILWNFPNVSNGVRLWSQFEIGLCDEVDHFVGWEEMLEMEEQMGT